MAVVNELVTKFSFDVGKGFKNFDKNLKKQARNVDRMTKRMSRSFANMANGLDRSLKSRIKIAGIKAAQRDLKRLQGAAGVLKSKIVAIGAATVGIGAVAGGLKRLITVGTQTEDVMTKLSLLRGPAQARSDFAGLNKIAAKTPFTLSQILDSYQQLNAIGVTRNVEEMGLFINSATIAKKGIDGATNAIISFARGSGQMVDEFAGFNGATKNGQIALDGLKDASGKATKVMLKGSAEGAREFIKLMNTQNRVKNGAEALSGTMTGLWSTFTSEVDNALRNFYNAGFGDALKTLTKGAINLAKAFKPVARNIGVVLGLKLKKWAKDPPKLFEKLGFALKAAGIAAGFFVANAIGIRAVLYADMIKKAAIALQAYAFSANTAGKAAAFAAIKTKALQVAIGGLVIALGAFVIAQGEFEQTGDSFLVRQSEKWLGLGDEVRGVHVAVKAIGMGIQDLMNPTEGWGKLASFWFEYIGDINRLMLFNLKEGWNMALDFVKGLLANFKQNAINTWNLIKEKVSEVGSNIKSSIMGALNAIGNFLATLPQKAINAFNGLVNAARNALANMPSFSGVMAGIGGALGFNSGGMVPGGFGTRDTVPAMLTPGEVVVPVSAVKQIQSGDPRGFGKVAELARTKMTGSQQRTYSMPASSVAGGGNSYASSVNAPINQTFTINAAQEPVKTARAVAGMSANGIRKELDFAARQYPKRTQR